MSGRRAGVPFSLLPESHLQHFRLLELPPELLELVTSEQPPILELKSTESDNETAKNANVVLCTPNKTYDVRQVSTSNSVYLALPKETSGGGVQPRIGIQAVAKCDSALELIPPTKRHAAPFIKAALPVYASTGNYAAKTITKTELFSNIPLSRAECEEGWSELACFESVNPSGCFVPSAKVRVEIWQTALTAAIAEGASLKDPYIADDIPAFALDLREDWPLELIAAVFRSISSSTPGGNLAIDEDRCVRVAGLNLLEAKSGSRATDTTGFLTAWRDAVVEAWRPKCNLSVLQGSYTLQDGGSTITFASPGTTMIEAPEKAADDAKASLGAKRKWHERFRASKKTS